MKIERLGSTWLAVKAWAEDELQVACARLETNCLSHEDSQHTRGRIAALRDLLKLAEDKPVLPASTGDYGLQSA